MPSPRHSSAPTSQHRSSPTRTRWRLSCSTRRSAACRRWTTSPQPSCISAALRRTASPASSCRWILVTSHAKVSDNRRLMSRIRKAPGHDRRSFLSLGGSTAAAMLFASAARANAQGFPLGPERIHYPSGVWKVIDERFRKYMVGNTPLIREWTGALWAEGSAWNGVGRYVVFSDIPNNRQLRWDEATGQTTPMRIPANFSNGNTFDKRGRQNSCEHETA